MAKDLIILIEERIQERIDEEYDELEINGLQAALEIIAESRKDFIEEEDAESGDNDDEYGDDYYC